MLQARGPSPGCEAVCWSTTVSPFGLSLSKALAGAGYVVRQAHHERKFPTLHSAPLAFQTGLLADTERSVVDALWRWPKARARGLDQVGGIHARHRFGGSLNLHMHGRMGNPKDFKEYG